MARTDPDNNGAPRSARFVASFPAHIPNDAGGFLDVTLDGYVYTAFGVACAWSDPALWAIVHLTTRGVIGYAASLRDAELFVADLERFGEWYFGTDQETAQLHAALRRFRRDRGIMTRVVLTTSFEA